MSDLPAGVGLPHAWRGRERFVVLDTDFGSGQRFFATWQAWRDDPQRCARLVVIALVPRAPMPGALHDDSCHATWPALADALSKAWPPWTLDLHGLDFDAGRVSLWLAAGDPALWLRELVVEIDAIRLGHPLPLDSLRLSKALGRLSAPGATLAAEAIAGPLRERLASVGFEVREPPEAGVTQARFAPAFKPRRAPSRGRRSDAGEPHALIVGAGLAGCAAAWALAGQGWRSTVLERRPRIASEASGNPAGLFHGIVNAHDGVHARFNRAAALAAQRAVQAAIDRGVAGSTRGLLRQETSLDVPRMRATLKQLGLPPDYLQALSADEASDRAGIMLAQPCWFYPGGGWVDPGGLARNFFERAGEFAALQTGVEAHRLERGGPGWRVLDAQDRLLAEASTLVLANAGDALRLIDAADWPVERVRGQVSSARASQLEAPKIPVAGSGYLLPAVAGDVMFGATSQPGDQDASVRDSDHAANLARLAQLLGHPIDLRPADLNGRTAWRCSAADRLPVIGAVPDPAARGPRLDQPRFVARLPGLYVFTALGSRGIGWCALGAQLLASCVSGAPAPIGASLIDAVDPARFVSRQVRRARPG